MRATADEWEPHGEGLSFPARLVVSPSWGRLHRAHPEGGSVEPETVMGSVRLGRKEHRLVSPFGGTLLGWLAWEGEAVWPGRPLAYVLPSPPAVVKARPRD